MGDTLILDPIQLSNDQPESLGVTTNIISNHLTYMEEIKITLSWRREREFAIIDQFTNTTQNETYHLNIITNL